MSSSNATDELIGGNRIFAEFERIRKSKIKEPLVIGDEWFITIKLRNFENDQKTFMSQ